MSLLTTQEFDPDLPEGAKPRRSQYINKKEIGICALALVVLGIFFWPVINKMLKDSENTVCIRNFTAIKGAMLVYSATYDDRFPPLYVQGENSSPQLFKGGVPNTWASVISANMTTAYGGFTCPSAQKEENTPTLADPQFSPNNLALSYGMYAPRAGRPADDVSDPSVAVLVAETSNMGARQSYDPYQYIKANDSVVPFDGMGIGWDDSNFAYSRQSKEVTRLAFYGVKNGNYSGKEVTTRHPEWDNYLSVDGTLGKLRPDLAYVTQSGNRLTGLWEAR